MKQQLLIPRAGDRSAGADISECGIYRYDLRRIWGQLGFKVVNWIMLNPSTADAEADDPTIRRCLGFSKAWGFGGMTVTNLFAFRATDPRELRTATNPVGPLNDEYTRRWASGADLVVAAWGAKGTMGGRADAVLRMLRSSGIEPMALRLSLSGLPMHPLYLPADLTPIPMTEGAVQP